MARVPGPLRKIKIKELRDMQKRGAAPQKQLADVLGTRLLASVSRPTLKRYTPSNPQILSRFWLIVENRQKMRHRIQTPVQVISLTMEY